MSSKIKLNTSRAIDGNDCLRCQWHNGWILQDFFFRLYLSTFVLYTVLGIALNTSIITVNATTDYTLLVELDLDRLAMAIGKLRGRERENG